MSDRRKANANWIVADENGQVPTWERVSIAVLLDIRDELQTLNRLLRCPNFTSIPAKLDGIRRNTAKPRKRKAVKRVR